MKTEKASSIDRRIFIKLVEEAVADARARLSKARDKVLKEVKAAHLAKNKAIVAEATSLHKQRKEWELRYRALSAKAKAADIDVGINMGRWGKEDEVMLDIHTRDAVISDVDKKFHESHHLIESAETRRIALAETREEMKAILAEIEKA